MNEFGDSNAPHVHPENHLACVVYIATGGDPTAKLELSDPRPNLHGRDLLLVNGTAPPASVLEVLRPGAPRALSVSAGTVVVFPACGHTQCCSDAGKTTTVPADTDRARAAPGLSTSSAPVGGVVPLTSIKSRP